MTAPRQYYDDGLIQLDREAITLRRYHFPSGTSKVIPLRSIRGYKAESLGLVHSAVPHLGQLGPAPLAATGRVAADQVHAGDARRARCAAQARVHAAAPEGVSGQARRAARAVSLSVPAHPSRRTAPAPRASGRCRRAAGGSPGSRPASAWWPASRSASPPVCGLPFSSR